MTRQRLKPRVLVSKRLNTKQLMSKFIHSTPNLPQVDDDSTVDLEIRAEKAFNNAFESALKANRSVVVVRNNAIVEVFPDGTERFIEQAAPKVQAKKGSVTLLVR